MKAIFEAEFMIMIKYLFKGRFLKDEKIYKTTSSAKAFARSYIIE